MAAALFACLPLAAGANPGWYVGIDAGKAQADAEIKDFILLGDVTAEDGATSNGFHVRGGYQFGRFFAVELGVADYGDFEYSFDPDDCPIGAGGSCAFSVSTSFRGYTLSMMGILPLGERWSLHARAGMSETEAKSHQTGGQMGGGDLEDSTREAGLQFAVGVGFKMDDHWQFQLNHSTIEALDFGFGLNLDGAFGVFDMGDAKLTSLGIIYHW
jgi:OOP family OmpA-OmpF porin